MNFTVFSQIFCPVLLGLCFSGNLWGLDYISYAKNGETRGVAGHVMLEASDGIVLETRDGQYHIITPKEVLQRRSDETPFTPMSQKEMREHLEAEFPKTKGFSLLEKEHFFIVYTTSQAYASWYGMLLEKLYVEYQKSWKGRGVTLHDPEFPMVVLLYSNRLAFFRHAAAENTVLPEQVCAYYNKLTNRTVMCDLSGMETEREGVQDRATTRNIQTFLEKPDAAFNVATVIHEATHQIGFNCGMHRRFAPYPLWVCEGLALFYEVPDRGRRVGWSGKTRTNDLRLGHLKAYLVRNPPSPLQDMIKNDRLFLQTDEAIDNYAMAWGLTYYLIQKRPKEFVKYLKKLSEKTILSEDSPEIRIRDFEECFGNDWPELYKDCGNYLKKL